MHLESTAVKSGQAMSAAPPRSPCQRCKLGQFVPTPQALQFPLDTALDCSRIVRRVPTLSRMHAEVVRARSVSF